MEITFQQAIVAHNKGRLEEAEGLYRDILEVQPIHPDVNNNLGVLLASLGRLDEAEECYRKAIKFKTNYAEPYHNLSITLNNCGKFDEAEANSRKAIELKPDYVDAYNNLGNVLKNLTKFDEAEANYRKAIELKPDYVDAYNNLGNVLKDLAKFDEAEASYRKAIQLNPDYVKAHNSLDLLLREKGLLSKIFQIKKSVKNKVNNNSIERLTTNPFITHRDVETELLKDLYKVSFKELDKTEKGDARYGNGRCSDFNFLENNFPTIKNATAVLIKIMSDAVKSEIFIMDTFLNIYRDGSGTTPHNHISIFDKDQGLVNQKFSLTYYLSVGDQNCSEPGNLKIYNPEEEVLLSDGKIVILPALRTHSAVYGGKKDRVMIGINFYSLF